MNLIRKVYQAFSEWLYERRLKGLRLYPHDGIAKNYDVENLKKDVEELLKHLGLERRSMMGILFNESYGDGKTLSRFEKKRKR